MFIDGCPSWLRPKTGRESNDKIYIKTHKN
jgi:hypothetical protein